MLVRIIVVWPSIGALIPLDLWVTWNDSDGHCQAVLATHICWASHCIT